MTFVLVAAAFALVAFVTPMAVQRVRTARAITTWHERPDRYE